MGKSVCNRGREIKGFKCQRILCFHFKPIGSQGKYFRL